MIRRGLKLLGQQFLQLNQSHVDTFVSHYPFFYHNSIFCQHLNQYLLISYNMFACSTCSHKALFQNLNGRGSTESGLCGLCSAVYNAETEDEKKILKVSIKIIII